jgi:hypothetical protein
MQWLCLVSQRSCAYGGGVELGIAMKSYLFTLAVVLVSAFTCPGALPPKANLESEAFSGKVIETMNAGSYTYVRVDTGKAKNWAAAPKFAVKVGDKVDVTKAMPMADYHSKTLNRTFDVVYFTGSVAVNGKPTGAAAQDLPKDHPPIGGQAGNLPQGHPPVGADAAKSATDFSKIKKATDGKTVAEIVTGRSKLRNKPVAVRGKVVKYNGGVMGKNWLHIRDGSGAEGSNDLTVTTSTEAKVGDTVLVTGKVSTDRDFGGGYKYAVIVEDAKVVVE